MENELNILLSYSDIVRLSLPRSESVDENKMGVYFLIDENKIVYVGSCLRIEYRMITHLKSDKVFDRWFFIPYKDLRTARLDESDYIWDICPKYNKKDNPDWVFSQIF